MYWWRRTDGILSNFHAGEIRVFYHREIDNNTEYGVAYIKNRQPEAGYKCRLNKIGA